MYAYSDMRNGPTVTCCIYSTCTSFSESRDPGIAEIGMPGHGALRRVLSVFCPLVCHLSLAKMSHGSCCICNDAFILAQHAYGA